MLAAPVLNVQADAGNQEEDSPTDFSQQLRYEVAPVIWHTRPMREKQYPDMRPMNEMRTVAGMRAEGALPKAATPAGRDNTPAPTIFLTRLKTSFWMVALPSFAPPRTSSRAMASSCVGLRPNVCPDLGRGGIVEAGVCVEPGWKPLTNIGDALLWIVSDVTETRMIHSKSDDGSLRNRAMPKSGDASRK